MKFNSTRRCTASMLTPAFFLLFTLTRTETPSQKQKTAWYLLVGLSLQGRGEGAFFFLNSARSIFGINSFYSTGRVSCSPSQGRFRSSMCWAQGTTVVPQRKAALQAHCWFFFTRWEDAQVPTAKLTRWLVSMLAYKLMQQHYGVNISSLHSCVKKKNIVLIDTLFQGSLKIQRVFSGH